MVSSVRVGIDLARVVVIERDVLQAWERVNVVERTQWSSFFGLAVDHAYVDFVFVHVAELKPRWLELGTVRALRGVEEQEPRLVEDKRVVGRVDNIVIEGVLVEF